MKVLSVDKKKSKNSSILEVSNKYFLFFDWKYDWNVIQLWKILVAERGLKYTQNIVENYQETK